MIWTHEETERLRKLQDDGLSHKQKAEAMGLTMDSIASKVKQLGITRECETAWTDDNVELLRQLWLDGASASQCAAAIGRGLTRNAVIGKAHRLGLAKRPPRAGIPGSQKVRAPARARRQFNGLQPTPAVVARPTVVAAPIECVGVTLLDLNQGMCKWSLGDERYCGNSAPWRASYCQGHAAVAYVPTAHRNRPDRQYAPS